jgi:hypothetical protein
MKIYKDDFEKQLMLYTGSIRDNQHSEPYTPLGLRCIWLEFEVLWWREFSWQRCQPEVI